MAMQLSKSVRQYLTLCDPVLQISHLTIMNIQNRSETKFFICRTELLGILPDCIMSTALEDNSFLYVQEWV